MEYTEEQRLELKKLIEETGCDLMADMEAAKEALDELAKSVNENFGMKAAIYKRMVKLYFRSIFSEEKAKTDSFNDLYMKILEIE